MTKLSDNTRGAILMALSMAAFTTNDSFMKGLLEEIPLLQALTLRGLLNIAMILVILPVFIGPVRFDLSRKDWIFTLLRAGAEVGASFSFLTAIIHIPLANATAIMQTLPLSITVVGALLFKDQLGWRRLAAILIGFCGVLLIVKPGGEGFSAQGLWAVLGMGFVTVRDLSVRAISPNAPTATVTFAAVAAVTIVAGGLSLGSEWQPLSTLGYIQLLGTSGFVIIGYVLSVTVMRVGEISFVSPFRYTALIWALLIGFFAFGEWPDLWALIGAGIIATTGIYTVLREARLRRRADGLVKR
ncbi:S-adenosylmethionine uptake transporter [Celeribacter baekdonensis]|uniref:S-adenosylmethionine uptake transporter n=1 Tax=Celeribacter baekdonensis TaxID=875171 RepID=A0A1G7UR96_9RHOB|nr:DMT family transporter [Celeribacter baekdonensis]SDG50072.1 S-adenosylmethionine uptake transporter [Celeribacter baekdonensis]